MFNTVLFGALQLCLTHRALQCLTLKVSVSSVENVIFIPILST